MLVGNRYFNISDSNISRVDCIHVKKILNFLRAEVYFFSTQFSHTQEFRYPMMIRY